MHHANLIVGNTEWGLAQVPMCDRESYPDVVVSYHERMSIADVRTLIYEAGLRPVSREYRSFVVSTQNILGEAQNALLKLFEEPNDHTVFYLIIPEEDILLKTLRSRLILFAREEVASDSTALNAFLKLSYAERIDQITKKIKDEDTAWVSAITQGLSIHAHTTKDKALMEDVLMLETYIRGAGSSKKMLLEHVALTL
jgi:hypothetical protein